MRLRLVLYLLSLLLVGCTAPADAPAPALAGDSTATPMPQPDYCRGDGAVQSWLLWPLDPPDSSLLAAYREREVIEFNATVIGAYDEFARLPHRAFILGEVAEGITMTLDYQGDPPPLVVGQTYRMVAWADPSSVTPAGNPQSATIATGAAVTPTLQFNLPSRAVLENYQSYELQVFDALGLLFLGATDVDLQDDPLDIRFNDTDDGCPVVSTPGDGCVQSRQVLPLTVGWGQDEVTLYPGQDGQLSHNGNVYAVSVFRNRRVQETDPPCAGYYEHRRSLRIERIEPPPLVPTPATVTATITTTLPITPLIPQP